jgi:hypothetical protein
MGRRPLAWLALVPAWTERLALACGFPISRDLVAERSQTPAGRLDAFLRAAVASGVCIRDAPPGPGGMIAWHQARALAGLVPYLPPDLRAEALDRARSFADPRCRIAVLTAALTVLPRDEADALAVPIAEDARSFPPRERAEALARVLVAGPVGPRRSLVGEALEAARQIGDEEDRARLLMRLAPYADPDGHEVAVELARAIRAEGPRAGALAALAATRPEPDRTALGARRWRRPHGSNPLRRSGS